MKRSLWIVLLCCLVASVARAEHAHVHHVHVVKEPFSSAPPEGQVLRETPTLEQRALFDADVTLRGRNASAGVLIDLPEAVTPERSATLKLGWQLSELVSRERSMLGVYVDGEPVLHTLLSAVSFDAGEQHWNVPLRALKVGSHTLELRAKLYISDDPCLERLEDAAWLTLNHASLLETLVPESGAAGAAFSARILDWQHAHDRQVIIDPPSSMNRAAASGFLDAEAWLRSLGLTPVLAPTQTDVSHRLTLRVATDANVPAALQQALASSSDALAVASFQGDRLMVVAKRAEALSPALVQLESPVARELCADPCLLTAGVREVPQEQLFRADPHSPQVLTLGTAGYAHGFVAQGAGVHHLRLVQQRLPSWTVTSAPILDLYVRYPGGNSGIDRARSTLNVRVNDIPLSTWHLVETKGDNESLLRVRIPEALWKDDAWVIDVSARLYALNAETCRASDDEQVWLTLGPGSTLYVERDEQSRPGIALFAEYARGERPDLLWSDALDFATLHASEPLLSAIARTTPEASWRWVDMSSGHVVWIANSANLPPLLKTPEAAPQYWNDVSHKLHLPLVKLADTLRLSYVQQEGADILLIEVGGGQKTPADAPDFAALLGDHALWVAGRWRPLDEPRAAAQVVQIRMNGAHASNAPSDAARVVSDREQLAMRANIIWAALASVIIALAWLRLRRRPVRGLHAGMNIETPAADERTR